MQNLYILLRGYFPGLAPNNRYMGWLKCFDELGIKATVFNVRPNDSFDRMPEIYTNLRIVNLWESNLIKTKNRHLRFLIHHFNLWKFSRIPKRGDIVWVYDLPEALPKLVNKKGVAVYNEVTEHPCIGTKNNSVSKRRQNCFKRLAGLFVISTALKKVFLDLGLIDDKVHIINMTVDPYRFIGLTKQLVEPYIAFCGNGSNNKDGVDQLIKCFARVHCLHKEFKLWIIGPEPKQGDASGNIELIEQLGLENAVVFAGRKSPNEVPQLLKNAKILALNRPDSLQAQNGFPTKLGEYLLTENPVCVTNVGDIPLFLKDGESALVAKHDNIDDFTTKLLWAIENPEEATRIGEKGAEVALTHFNTMTEVKKMIKVMNLKNRISL